MSKVKTWPQFAKTIRAHEPKLLQALPNYHRPIFVAGCQRSGGTMLARTITEHPQMQNFSWGKDAELDAALLLSGAQPTPTQMAVTDRYCFQTTYLNERGVEYLDHPEHFHLIWLVRNPYSVVYSMVYNWKRFALNEVFASCGLDLMPEEERNRFERFGTIAVRPIDRACYAWLGKAAQCSMLLEKLPPNRMTSLSYEDLVQNRSLFLGKLYDFAELSRQSGANSDISTRSLKKSAGLSEKQRARVKTICESTYTEHMDTSIRLRA